ncbi:MAG: hypothetical protein ACR2JJ_04135 [Sphingomicrobium sp.]
MRVIAAFLLAMAGAGAEAQPYPLRRPAAAWQPTAPYVTIGQDEPGYRNWYMASPVHPLRVRAFNAYLTVHGVGGVVPTWQLLRTASDWRKCGGQPFEVPPTEHWPNIVHALRYVGAFIEPVIGDVEPVSAYRNAPLNACAAGAATSTHLTGGGIDMVPLRPLTRESLMVTLCRIQLDSGRWNGIGLGLYKGVRFHIDSRKFREWGMAGARGGFGCAAVLAEGPMPYVPEAIAPPAAASRVQR